MALINAGIAECARVCSSWLLVKATDYVNGRRLQLGHVRVLAAADRVGMTCHDLIIHASGTGPGGGQIARPIRARRAHSYLVVLKPRQRRRPVSRERTRR